MKLFRHLIIAFVLLFLTQTVFAASNYSVDISFVQARTDSGADWAYQPSGSDNDLVDVRAFLYLNTAGYEPYAKVFAYAKIYGDRGNGYEYIKQTETKRFYLYPKSYNYANTSYTFGNYSEAYFAPGSAYYFNYPNKGVALYQDADGEVQWGDAFRIDDRYNNYKIVVYAGLEEDNVIQDEEWAYVNVSGGGSGGNYGGGNGGGYYGNADVQIRDNYFSPGTITVYEGDTVEWVNLGNNSHTVTFENTGGDSGTLNYNGTYRKTFNTEGTYYYHCRFHSEMTGTVRVLPRNGNGGGSGNSSCADITVNTHSVYVNENESVTERFSVRNNSDRTFYVDEVNVSDNSSYFNATEGYFSPSIAANGSGELEARISAGSVDFDQSSSATAGLRGRFSDGRTCSFSEIGDERFNVFISNNGASGNASDISFDNHSVTLNENDQRIETFTIRNDSGKRFYVEEVQTYTPSSDFSPSVSTYDSQIDGRGSGRIRLRFVSSVLTGDKTVKAYYKVRGRFEGGPAVSFDDIGLQEITVYLNDNAANFSSSCSSVYINAGNVSLGTNSTEYASFDIVNNSNSRFYISSAGATDNSGYFNVRELDYDNSIAPGGRGRIRVRVDSFDRSNVEGTATVRASGYFSESAGNRQCSGISESFSVRVDNSYGGSGNNYNGSDNFNNNGYAYTNGYVDQASCPDFKLVVPKEIALAKEDKVLVSIENPLGRSATIIVKGIGATAAPDTITVPKNSFTAKLIDVQLLSGSAQIVFDTTLSGCSISEKTSQLKLVSGQRLADRVTIGVETEAKGNETEITVTLQNKSDSLVSGTIEIGLPKEFSGETTKDLTLAANETRKIAFTVKQDKGIDKEVSVPVRFTAGNEQVTKTVQLKPAPVEGNAVSTAFAIIADNALTAGLIIIIIILVIALIIKMRN
ncbi:MAG: cupredoxin domain-containing protein [Candidatus Diapherotrites archaeon]|nr:cupredoxin domain-containing protein [Candidatus Diapherotrites archaeon]